MFDPKGREIDTLRNTLLTGDAQPAIDLYDLLVRYGCMFAANGLLHDLKEWAEEADHQIESTSDRIRFLRAAQMALRACEQGASFNLERTNRDTRTIASRLRRLFQFSIAHMLVLTTVCAVAVSFAEDLAAVAVVYCCFLLFAAPLFGLSLYRGFCHDPRSARSALLNSLTMFLAFSFAMMRPEIRAYYPLPLQGIPIALVIVSVLVLRLR